MHILDDLPQLGRLDQQGMLGYVTTWPEQLERGRAMGATVELPASYYRNIVFLGTGGGSAAAAHLAKGMLLTRLPVPFSIHQGYQCPAEVGPETLVLVSSFSGNTEETVQATRGAIQRGAAPVIFTGGGGLLDLANASGLPLAPLPKGMMPRVAAPTLFAALLAIFERLGLIQPLNWGELAQVAAKRVSQVGPRVPVCTNPAKSLAAALNGYIPVIYGAGGTAAIAQRMKNQLAENGKTLALWNSIPDLHHDEIVGWDMADTLTSTLYLVFLRDEQEAAKISKRFEATEEVLRPRAAGFTEVWPSCPGASDAARFIDLAVFADFVSIYAALAKGVDPTPVAIIDLFKAKMGQPGR